MAREFHSVEEAKIAGIVHIEAGNPVRGYLKGDVLPAHMRPPVPSGAKEVTLQDLDARLKALEAVR